MFTGRLALALSLVALATSLCNYRRLSEDVGLTDEYRREIVDYHNELRNYVAKGEEPTQPPAQDMRELTWDNDLEKTAQEWADNCDFGHDPRLKNTMRGTGQNLLMQFTKSKQEVLTLDFKQYIFSWYNEVRDYGYNGTYNYRTGRYAQLIWGATKKVGCGYLLTKQTSFYNVYFVCNYLPGGNVADQLPYVYGEVDCEGNSMFRSSNYSNLCDINKSILLACRVKDQTENYSTSTGNNL